MPAVWGSLMADTSTLKPGVEPFPGYRLRQVLGGGGFGEVWEAEKQRKERTALKFLFCDNGTSASREIRTLQSVRALEHPNLIKLDQIWCFGGFVVFEMELADGSLQDLFEAYQLEFKTPIPPEKACVYLSQAAEAIDFLNARQHRIEGKKVGIQHCDIKPSNLLLFGETVKLCDFGLTSYTSAKMQSQRRAGTLDFMAPEQFQGRVSDWTDQYALAVTYCLMRGGRLPFTDTPEKFDKLYTRPEPDLSMLPPNEQSIVARAMSRVPHDRWPTCRDFMKALSEQIVRAGR
jgi:serine/threonine protein kinase